ncbi:GNAT family N-acetyltransferase [Kitasatospora sp. NBC_01300]|uniref:GNAT family N-acetyltransferase n=1 Tax=Kitasatospora sp. NBC_01300 TaxID=2903574 RepID=UPI002F917EF9|nr:GNAT family N-acetyltransferase [Kitasatospora sp. NBC_01300]
MALETKAGTATEVRAASARDAEELLRLRVAVLAGEPVTAEWRATFLADMKSQLGRNLDLVGYVAETGDTLAACAVGTVYRGIGGPGYPQGLWARIHLVVADPRFRRRGLASECMNALVADLRARGCTSIELRSSDEGVHLYRSLGFVEHGTYMALPHLTGTR